jgi:ribosomal protein S24E
MSIIETVSDVNNSFLSRRELTCNFSGLGGKLKKLESIDMITKQFKLDGKIVIPIKLQNHVGKPLVTGTFYVYDDEKLAKVQVNPTVFSRLEKAKKPKEEKKEEKPVEKKAEEKEIPEKADDAKADQKKDDKKDEKPSEELKSEKKSKESKPPEKKSEEKSE